MAKAFETKTIEHRWAAIVKNPKGYIDPYKVVVGSSRTFHSWHSTRVSAVKETARINKAHSGWLETKRVRR